MKNIEIQDYSVFCDERGFISPFVIARVIVSSIGFYSFHELYRICREIDVILTDEEIEKFLNSRIKTEYPELDQRMDEYQKKENKTISERHQHTMDVLFLSGMTYNSYTLKYFKQCISILKKKCLILFEIFDSISRISLGVMDSSNGDDIDSINRLNEYLKKYDIFMSEDGTINYEDFIRLVDPFVYNVTELLKTVEKANDLSTYLEFSISLDSVYRSGLNEQDIYPDEKLQNGNMEDFNSNGYIVLSKRQKARKHEKDHQIFQFFLNRIQ